MIELRHTPVTAYGEMTSLSEWKRQAGQRIVLGIETPGITADDRLLIKEIQPAGFILFKRNIEDPAQVLELNRELASLVSPHYPPILSLDQEGGRVQRIREPATVWPPMRHVGRAETLTAQISKAMALELRAMGFNLNYAPVADVDSNPKNPVIGDRSFSDSPKAVAAHISAFIAAHQAEGVVACAKHFPGHGDTSVDSHLDLPKVEKEEPELREVELLPFRAAVAAKVGSVMTAHVIFSAFDEDLPATLSPKVLRRLLRKEMKYDGVVFSDDLEMKAVAGRWPIGEIVQRSTEAGVDVYLCCREPQLQINTFEALVQQQQEARAFARSCRSSAGRVHKMRERYWKKERAPVPLDILKSMQHRELAALAAERGKP